MWSHSKGRIFLYIIVFLNSSPTVVRILVEGLDSCFLTHINCKKYMTPIHALIFDKYVKMCVYIRQIKKTV